MAQRRPPFVQNVEASHPNKDVQVWFQDEARFGQQGALTNVWALRGSRPQVIKQTEYDWIYLFGAVHPDSGDSVALSAPTVNTLVMNHHLRMIGELLAPDVHVVLVLDQAGWHRSKGLKVPPNITLLPLPPYSLELNPIERLWSWLKSHQLGNRVFTDYDDLRESGTQAWNTLTPNRLKTSCKTKWTQRGMALRDRSHCRKFFYPAHL